MRNALKEETLKTASEAKLFQLAFSMVERKPLKRFSRKKSLLNLFKVMIEAEASLDSAFPTGKLGMR